MSEEKETIQSAVALSYESKSDVAPKIAGKGKGDLAKRMIQIAKENQIPIQKDDTLVELLSKLEVNETIPEELYQVVAEIFSFIYKLDSLSE